MKLTSYAKNIRVQNSRTVSAPLSSHYFQDSASTVVVAAAAVVHIIDALNSYATTTVVVAAAAIAVDAIHYRMRNIRFIWVIIGLPICIELYRFVS